MHNARVICDSTWDRSRLTTLQVTHPRIVHSEFMTHCAFARNASSSRAIPLSKMIDSVIDNPVMPVWWGKNQPGMQAREEIDSPSRSLAELIWLNARNQAVASAKHLASLGLHKQICNRLIEPWSWITCVVTGDPTAWSNYFALRCHPDAQPELQRQAYAAQLAYFSSEPVERRWHLPYLDDPQELDSRDPRWTWDTLQTHVKVSTGRCARVSYLTQDGRRDPDKDIELHDRLLTAKPMHASPFEHVAQAAEGRHGKYTGWLSYRHTLRHEMTHEFVPNHPQLTTKGESA